MLNGSTAVEQTGNTPRVEELTERDDTALCCLTEMVNSKNIIERKRGEKK